MTTALLVSPENTIESDFAKYPGLAAILGLNDERNWRFYLSTLRSSSRTLMSGPDRSQEATSVRQVFLVGWIPRTN
jgi:hypothetical protein